VLFTGSDPKKRRLFMEMRDKANRPFHFLAQVLDVPKRSIYFLAMPFTNLTKYS